MMEMCIEKDFHALDCDDKQKRQKCMIIDRCNSIIFKLVQMLQYNSLMTAMAVSSNITYDRDNI